MRVQAATVLAPMGLRLSAEKTKITHIDEGLDFLGWRIQRHRKRGTNRYYVYTYPSRKALKAVTIKVKAICRQQRQPAMPALMRQLNPALRGWCAYFRPGVSAATFAYLARYTWDRVLRWARRKHRRITVKDHPPPLLQRRVVADHVGDRPVQPGQDAAPRATATGEQPYRPHGQTTG